MNTLFLGTRLDHRDRQDFKDLLEASLLQRYDLSIV